MTKEKEKVAHTPGPWKVAPYYRTDVLAGSGRLVATTRPFGTTQAEQDAHLIAAAPDLLKAAKLIASFAVSWQPLTPGDIKELTNAIAKAEGRVIETEDQHRLKLLSDSERSAKDLIAKAEGK